MSRELDPAGGGPLSRSLSADSLSSVSSVAHNFGHDFTVGQLEVTLEYEARTGTLFLSLLQGKDLLEKEEEDFPSCFIRVTLLPDELSVGISRVRLTPFPSQAFCCTLNTSC